MKNLKKLTILHSNDMHGDFLAEQIDENLVGGVSMLSGYISKVRAEEKNVIYAIAGDMFRGSIIDSEYKGISTIEIMNALSPDIVTLGNHEIDYGISHLLFIEKCAQIPIINANLYIKTNGARLFSPYKILEIDDMRILFIGIITEEVLAQANQDPLIGSLIDTVDAAREVGRICNAYKAIDIDFTVILTHIGYEKDLELAALLDPEWGVDVIIGGHSHTFLEQPTLVNDILIAQAGTGTDVIGRFDIMVDTDTNSVDTYTWELVPIDNTHCPRDPQIEELINQFKAVTDKKYSRIITRFNRELTHPKRNMETALGNMFADVFSASLGMDIMLLGSGSIRKDTLGPLVNYGHLVETFPYNDAVHMMKIQGYKFRKMMKFMLREEAFSGGTEFYQVSKGVKMVYSRSKQDFESFTYNGQEIKDNDVFTVGMQDFHFKNVESFLNLTPEEVGELQKPRVVSTSCQDVIEEYLVQHHLLDSMIEGRITIVD